MIIGVDPLVGITWVGFGTISLEISDGSLHPKSDMDTQNKVKGINL
jgi:hypothetical protein